MKGKAFVAIILFMALFACKNKKTELRNQELNELNNLKEQFYQDLYAGHIDAKKAPLLAEKYEAFLSNWPKDSLCPRLLIELGSIYLNFMGDPNRAIQTFQRVENDYKKSDKLLESYFAIAEVYHDYLKEYDNAADYYKKIISEFPDDPLAKQAQILLDNLGKSPEELLNEIMKKNKAISDTSSVPAEN